MACDPKAANKWTARIIPVVLVGLIGYAAWVLTKLVCVDYLLHPPRRASIDSRPGSATAVLVLFYILLLPVLVCYGRLIQTIITNPGYMPLGPLYPSQAVQAKQPLASHGRGHARGHSYHGRNHHPHLDAPLEKSLKAESLSRSAGTQQLSETTLDEAQDFWKRDLFICSFDGRPNWCSKCRNFKTNRTHHCRETDRCVKKMDHFCPWVGGIISETSFKYFVQFTTYAAFFCTHILVTMAVLVAERKRKLDDLNIHWCIILGVSALFLVFSFGISLSSLQLALINSTTVENLSRKTKIWFIAVLISRPQDEQRRSSNQDFMTITYPRPFEEQQTMQQMNSPPEQRETPTSTAMPDPGLGQTRNQSANDSNNKPRQTFYPEGTPASGRHASPSSTFTNSALPYVEPRTFAILQSKPGQNPFDLGPLENLKQVLGNNYVDWFLPFRASPCADHTSHVSAYRMGKAVEEMKSAAGLCTARSLPKKRRKRRRKGNIDADRVAATSDRTHGSRNHKRRSRDHVI